MTILERVSQDMVAAMKARDQPRTDALRFLKAELKKKEIDKRSALEDGDAIAVIQSLAKQRQDSIDQFEKAGRTELADKEKAELSILKIFLPADVSEADIKAAVDKAASELGASSQKDMGNVMKAALAALKATGKSVDGKKVSEAVKARLTG